jgi:hypothetical protein
MSARGRSGWTAERSATSSRRCPERRCAIATGTILLPIAGAIPSDGSASNGAPAIQRVQGTEANPKKHYLIAAFDAAADEHLTWTFRLPSDYASAPIVELLWESNDTGATESAVWGARWGAVTPADADTPIEHAAAAASVTTTDVNATEARRLLTTSIALANTDSAAAGDLINLIVYRDGDGTGGTDDLTSDANLTAAALTYTTT